MIKNRCQNCGQITGLHHSCKSITDETKHKLSEGLRLRWTNPEYKMKMSNKMKAIGNTPPSWLGKKRGPQTKEHKAQIVKNLINKSGEEHFNWKGDEVGYTALHDWVRRYLGNAKQCNFNLTHKATKYHWANVSGAYLRDLTDWTQLCPSCHKQYDNLIPKPIKNVFDLNTRERISL